MELSLTAKIVPPLQGYCQSRPCQPRPALRFAWVEKCCPVEFGNLFESAQKSGVFGQNNATKTANQAFFPKLKGAALFSPGHSAAQARV
jgi:hypothetical protein